MWRRKNVKVETDPYADTSIDGYCYNRDDREIIDQGDCGENGDNVKWIFFADGTLSIHGKGNMAGFGNNYGVQLANPYEKYKGSIKTVEIEDGITSIGRGAFSNCGALENAVIPESVTTIEQSAFYSCGKLKNIAIPEGVKSIGLNAFGQCSSLTDISLPAGLATIGEWAFGFCSSLTNITIPNSVSKIENYAFERCSDLSDICVVRGSCADAWFTNNGYSDKIKYTFKAPVVTVNLNSSGKPVLTWDAVDGAAKYDVYKATSEDGPYSRLILTVKTKITHFGATEGNTYYYKVMSVDADGNTSDYGNVVKATV